jgi:uncharacterized FAD-dependent dehydrogenase
MAIRISNIRLHVDQPEHCLSDLLQRTLTIPPATPWQWRILRKSFDARHKAEPCFVYSVEVCLPEGEARLARMVPSSSGLKLSIDEHAAEICEFPPPGPVPLRNPPIIVGSGPAGLFAGYFLAEHGYAPLILERGRSVRDRIADVRAFDQGARLDPESNYLFGEGGAGTFSDGKLTSRGTGPDVRRVLELFAASKGKPSILYDYKPHLGSNRLPAVVKALRQSIERMGGMVRFNCRVEDLVLNNDRVDSVETSAGQIPASVVVLAVGHSARDTYAMLHRRGVPLAPKPFQLGVRIEQQQEVVNRSVYGSARLEAKLGAADYALTARGRHNLFTFCMCAGGHIIPSVSCPGYFSTNGMSLSRRDSPFANSGLMVTIAPSQFGSGDVLAGVRLQAIYERRAFELGRGEYLCPIQRAEDFMSHRSTKDLPPCSYTRGAVTAEIARLVPSFVVDALFEGLPIMDSRWRGRFLAGATLVGPEARGSSPVRIVRDARTRESPGISGLYPVGEGAGYAGGIVSAAVDGLRSARAIIAKYARPA